MRKSLWIMLAVLVVDISAPYASADIVTFDLSGSLAARAGSCSPCTLGGDIVIDNTSGTVISVDFTVAGESPSVGPFNRFIEFVEGNSELLAVDGASNIFGMFLSGKPGTLVGYTGGGISGNITPPVGNPLFVINAGAVLTEVVPAPEPSSVALMLLGVGLVFVMRKRIGQRLPQAS
jgi:hypothetical protein